MNQSHPVDPLARALAGTHEAKKPTSNFADEVFFREACAIVEARCRSLGKDLQVIFTRNGVEIAPLADAGSTTGPSLYATLIECEKWQ